MSSGGLFQRGSPFVTGTGRASLGLAEDHGSFAVASGRRELDNGGEHERILIWIREHGLVVVDRITESPDPLRVSFHFGPRLRAQSSGDSALEISDSGKVIMRVRAHGPPGVADHPGRDQADPGVDLDLDECSNPGGCHQPRRFGSVGPVRHGIRPLRPATSRERRESAVVGLTSTNGTTTLRFRARSEVWTIPVDTPLGSPIRDSAASKVP